MPKLPINRAELSTVILNNFFFDRSFSLSPEETIHDSPVILMDEDAKTTLHSCGFAFVTFMNQLTWQGIRRMVNGSDLRGYYSHSVLGAASDDQEISKDGSSHEKFAIFGSNAPMTQKPKHKPDVMHPPSNAVPIATPIIPFSPPSLSHRHLLAALQSFPQPMRYHRPGRP